MMESNHGNVEGPGVQPFISASPNAMPRTVGGGIETPNGEITMPAVDETDMAQADTYQQPWAQASNESAAPQPVEPPAGPHEQAAHQEPLSVEQRVPVAITAGGEIPAETARETEPTAPQSDESILRSAAAQLDSMMNEHAQDFDRLNGLFEAQDQDTNVRIQTSVEQYVDAHGREPSQLEAMHIVTAVLKEVGAPDSRQIAAEINDRISPHAAEAARLEALAAHHGERALTQARNNVLQQADWQKVVAKYTPNDGEYADFHTILSLVQAKDAPQEYGGIIHEVDSLKHIGERLAQNGDVLPEGVTWQAPEGWQPNEQLRETVQQWEQDVRGAYDYLALDRREELRDNMRKIRDIRFLITDVQTAAESRAVQQEIPAPIAYALERVFDDKRAEFHAADEAALARNGALSPDEIQITGAELAQSFYGIEDPAAWVKNELAKLPPDERLELKSVTFIEAKTFGPDATRYHGEMSSNGRHMKLYVHTDELALRASKRLESGYNPVTNKPFTLKDTQAGFALELRDVFDHEATHHVHERRMTVAELMAWDAVVAEQPDLDMDDYVAEVRERHESRGPLGARAIHKGEQLATARAMYFNHPHQMRTISEQRFDFMNARHQLYDVVQMAELEEMVASMADPEARSAIVRGILLGTARQKIAARNQVETANTQPGKIISDEV